MKQQQLKVIMVGSLADGFSIHSVVPDNQVNLDSLDIPAGRLVDCLELGNPFELDPHAKGVCKNGSFFVGYACQPADGLSIYGPFTDDVVAEKFAEDNRSEDDSWSIFELNHNTRSAHVQHFTVIMQHRIKFWLRDVEDKKAPAELDDCSIEHITKLIGEGYNQGELCILGDDGDTEFRGWWNIERNCNC